MPFKDFGSVEFFRSWFKVNDGLVPGVFSREEWQEHKRTGIIDSKMISVEN